jgi:hypothetical protein
MNLDLTLKKIVILPILPQNLPPDFSQIHRTGKINAQKIGNGWKVFKADLDKFVRGA